LWHRLFPKHPVRQANAPADTATIRDENARAALGVMSRFAVDPRWLLYLPPARLPSATDADLSDTVRGAVDARRQRMAPGAECTDGVGAHRAVLPKRSGGSGGCACALPAARVAN
ncbi:MAG TPA: hypothetical protein VN259_05155, partial [Xanthomonadales bacterium]|nr:hypothetical protein [Xanthomonadales bacterium]